MHPRDRKQRGSPIVMRNNIKQYVTNCYTDENIQAMNIVLQGWIGPITTALIYCPPRCAIQRMTLQLPLELSTSFHAWGPLKW